MRRGRVLLVVRAHEETQQEGVVGGLGGLFMEIIFAGHDVSQNVTY